MPTAPVTLDITTAPAPLLTIRELAVLRRIAYGLTNRQIGRELFIGEDAVKFRIRGMLRALQARDRAHAISRAMALGVLRPGDGAQPWVR